MHEHTLSIRQAATDTLKMPQGRTLQICFKSHQSLMWCGEWQNSCMHSITAAEVDSRGGASHWVRICCIDMEANRQNTKQVAEEKQETENNSWRYFQIETESEGKKKKGRKEQIWRWGSFSTVELGRLYAQMGLLCFALLAVAETWSDRSNSEISCQLEPCQHPLFPSVIVREWNKEAERWRR